MVIRRLVPLIAVSLVVVLSTAMCWANSSTPTLVIAVPAQDLTTSQDTLALQGTVSDALGYVTVIITIDGQTFMPAVINGNFQQQVTFTTAKQYSIVVTATDQTGNFSTVQRNVIYTVREGDVNNDRRIDVFDGLQALQYAVGLIQPADEASFKTAADVAPLDASCRPQGDGRVNVFDALAILRHAVGLDGW